MNYREKAYAIAMMDAEEVRFPSVAMPRKPGRKPKKKLKGAPPDHGGYT